MRRFLKMAAAALTALGLASPILAAEQPPADVTVITADEFTPEMVAALKRATNCDRAAQPGIEVCWLAEVLCVPVASYPAGPAQVAAEFGGRGLGGFLKDDGSYFFMIEADENMRLGFETEGSSVCLTIVTQHVQA